MFDKRYKLKRITGADPEDPESGAFDMRTLLLSGVPEGSLDEFLDPGKAHLCDPFLLPDVEAAVDRILEAAENDELVAVFGDYDCDGICATAVMYDFLVGDLSLRTVRRVPERAEGYGLSTASIDELYSLGVTLIVTVDCGISSQNEIHYAKELGIDVIVTDHHEVPAGIPDAVAVIDPKRDCSVYQNRDLCGCAVAYKLCEAVADSVGIEGTEKYLPVVMTATIGDVMRLTGENRSLVFLGLRSVKDSPFIGFNALVNEFILKNDPDKTVSSRDVSFSLVPKINAAGRMGYAGLALDLMLSPDVETAEDKLRELLLLNEKRKDLEDEIIRDYRRDPARYELNDRSDAMLFVRGDGWPHGITGIIAARILDDVNRPVCVMSRDESVKDADVVKASVRSTDGVKSIIDVFSSCKELFISFGGHEKALGFSAKSRNVPKIISACLAKLEESGAEAVPYTEVLYIPARALTIENAEKLAVLEPTGEGNKTPLFITDGILSVDSGIVGAKNNALRFDVRIGSGETLRGINFSDVRFADMIKASKPFAVVFELKTNVFRGVKSVSLEIKDLIEGDPGASALPVKESYKEGVERLSGVLSRAFRFTLPELRDYYRFFASLGNGFDFGSIYNAKRSGMKFSGNFTPSWFKIKFALELFRLGGFISVENGKYVFAKDTEGAKLFGTRIYAELVDE
ncbi:MAG: single-stranded-DNA-specific exonuclease RecJ [Clostridia bacterium]|nr:single-stranded-DNA-specific exonuclease RecJ [Clostridia bacterium]